MEGLEQDLGRWPGTHFPSNKGRWLIHIPASQDGIKPMWGDSRNKPGGRWLVGLTRQRRHPELDYLWLETVSGGLGGRLGGQGSQGKRLGWCGGSGLKDGRGSLCAHQEASSSSFSGPAAVSHRGELWGAQPGSVWGRHQHLRQGGQDCCVDTGGREPRGRAAHWVRGISGTEWGLGLF